MTERYPLADFDFACLKDNDCREEVVREEVVAPLLRGLGFSASGANRIVRNRALKTPFLMVGTNKRSVVVPDYVLYVKDKPAWVLDAKRPTQPVMSPENVGQVHSYAIHREVNVAIFALCNGYELATFITSDQSYDSSSVFDLKNPDCWGELVRTLSPAAFVPDEFSAARSRFLKVRSEVVDRMKKNRGEE